MKNPIVRAFILFIIIFIVFVFFYERYTKKKLKEEVDNFSEIIARSLWNYDSAVPKNYLEIHCRKGNYQTLTVKGTYGEVFIHLENELDGSFNQIFLFLKLIRLNSTKSSIFFRGKNIGVISANVYNTSIYLYLYLMAVILLILTVLLFFLRVQERSKMLQKTNVKLNDLLDTLKDTQDQLVQSEKMSALGGLVAGIAHEINTPVGISLTASSFLEQKTKAIEKLFESDKMNKDEFEKYLKTATEATSIVLTNLKRGAELIQSFKQVAVDQSNEEIRYFSFRKCIDETLLSLRPNFRNEGHEIDVFIQKDIYLTNYPGAFSQIFTNLVMNSVIHGFGKDRDGHMEIKASCGTETLEIKYSDNGVGMDSDTIAKIYDPFFTTKRGKGGNGLGMNIVYNLVTQKLKGEIHCESAPSKGASFTITIPVVL